MTKFAELVSEKDLTILAAYATDAVLDVAAYRETDGTAPITRFVIPTRWDKSQEVGEHILRYFHAYMWQHSVPIPPKKAAQGYARAWYGYLTDVARDLGVADMMTPNQLKNFAGDISRLFHVNGLARRNGAGKTKEWFLRPWSEGTAVAINKRSQVRLTDKDEHAMVKSLEREGEKPVKTMYDISQIPLPDRNPDSVFKYLEKVVKAFTRLNEAYRKVTETNDELCKTVEKLQAELEAREQDEWGLLVDKIGHLVDEAHE